MANENVVSIQISPEDLKRVAAAFAEIDAVLKPYIIALKPEERKTMLKMGDKSVPFVEKVIEYIVSNPEFVPVYMDTKALNIDFQAVSDLNTMMRPAERIYTGLNDTILLSGSEAYNNALTYYNSVKEAAKKNVPNAKTIYDDLSKRFDRIKAKKEKDTE